MFETGISVTCGVTVGTFMSEYSVKIEDASKKIWEGPVDKEMVIGLQKQPSVGVYVPGRIYAYLIEFNKETALIELPVENLGEGRRVYVPLPMVKRERVPA